MSLLSHISAFEYWRLVGTPGFPMPRTTRTTNAPSAFNGEDFEWFTGMGLLSLPLHGLTSKKYKNHREAICRHKSVAQLPSGSIMEISKTRYVTSPELTLLHIAQYLSFAELAGLVCEFCGFYTVNEACETGIARREPLTSTVKILAFCDKARNLNGVKALRQAAYFALDKSRSPMETAAALFLTLPQQRGGYSLRGAQLNSKITLGVKARKIANIDKLEPDILWANEKIVVEYDSDTFHFDDARIANDARRKNAFLASGFRVITLTSKQLFAVGEMDKVASQIALCMRKRVRKTNVDLFAMRQRALRFDLLDSNSVIRKQYSLSERASQARDKRVRNTAWPDDDDACMLFA